MAEAKATKRIVIKTTGAESAYGYTYADEMSDAATEVVSFDEMLKNTVVEEEKETAEKADEGKKEEKVAEGEKAEENKVEEPDIPSDQIPRHEIVSFANGIALAHANEPYEKVKKLIVDSIRAKYGFKTSVKYEAMLWANYIHFREWLRGYHNLFVGVKRYPKIAKEATKEWKKLSPEQKKANKNWYERTQKDAVEGSSNDLSHIRYNAENLASVITGASYTDRFSPASTSDSFRFYLSPLAPTVINPYTLKEITDEDFYHAIVCSVYWFYNICIEQFRSNREAYKHARLVENDAAKHRLMWLDSIEQQGLRPDLDIKLCIKGSVQNSARSYFANFLERLIQQNDYTSTLDKGLVIPRVIDRFNHMTDEDIYREYMLWYYDGRKAAPGVVEFVRNAMSQDGVYGVLDVSESYKALDGNNATNDVVNRIWNQACQKSTSLARTVAAEYGVSFRESNGIPALDGTPYDPESPLAKSIDEDDAHAGFIYESHETANHHLKCWNITMIDSGSCNLALYNRLGFNVGKDEDKAKYLTKEEKAARRRNFSFMKSTLDIENKTELAECLLEYQDLSSIVDMKTACAYIDMILQEARAQADNDKHLHTAFTNAERMNLYETEHVSVERPTEFGMHYDLLLLPEIALTLKKVD